MEIRRCLKCMYPLQPQEGCCPVCGQEYGRCRMESFALKPGTILDGKYLVGEMLGQGGFGITYIGFDLLLEQKVAIKEYYPMSTGFVSRENGTTVIWSSAMQHKSGTAKGFDSFLKEARKMARLGGIPGIVGVKSVFIQNETAYIVMDYVEGETLLKKLQREGPMAFDACVSLLMPIMEALEQVHRHGIIHRDISPDNIMVQPEGQLVLLDLGAAKDLELQQEDGVLQSSQLVAKHGFSPIEQYGQRGKIGPWTDVYAMAATIYYCCTGTLPPMAVDRMVEDELCPRLLLSNDQFAILAEAMQIKPEQRPQGMAAWMAALARAKARKIPEKTKAPKAPKPPRTEKAPKEIRQPEQTKKKKSPKWLIIAAAALICILSAVTLLGKTVSNQETTPQLHSPSGTEAHNPPETTVPMTPEEKAYAEAEALLTGGETAKAAIAFGKLGDYADARERSFALWDQVAVRDTISAMDRCGTAALREDGSVLLIGGDPPKFDREQHWKTMNAEAAAWTDVVAIAAGGSVFGLKADGTIVWTDPLNDYSAVDDWRDIVSISASNGCFLGLKMDGTVLTAHAERLSNPYTWLSELSEWSDIVSVSAGSNHALGLRSDGTVVLSGEARMKGFFPEVDGWKDVTAIYTGSGANILALHSDGTLSFSGTGQYHTDEAAAWEDIVSAAVGIQNIIGLRSDGTVVAVGYNTDGSNSVKKWTDIVAIDTGGGSYGRHTVGLKSDGTVVAVGNNSFGQCRVKDWTDIKLPN